MNKERFVEILESFDYHPAMIERLWNDGREEYEEDDGDPQSAELALRLTAAIHHDKYTDLVFNEEDVKNTLMACGYSEQRSEIIVAAMPTSVEFPFPRANLVEAADRFRPFVEQSR